MKLVNKPKCIIIEEMVGEIDKMIEYYKKQIEKANDQIERFEKQKMVIAEAHDFFSKET